MRAVCIDKNDANLFDVALACLMCCSTPRKLLAVNELYAMWQQNRLHMQSHKPPHRIKNPGRPKKPMLVHPRKVPRRNLSSEQGRTAMIHAIAHIEFNAINLAVDAVYRFRAMPRDYYADWLKIAYEEARHFKLLQERLSEFGCKYGDFTAHNGL